MAPVNLPLIETHYPATFRERGIAVPFTTPMLAGARVRDTGRNGVELVVPNPSGARGVYVVPVTKVRDQYRPTVHDIILLQRIAGAGALDPSSVRAAAWAVALEGFAGPQARQAAEAIARSDRSQALMTEFLLLNAVVEQVEPGGVKITSVVAQAAELERRGRGVLARIGRSLGRSGAELGDALAAMAVSFAPVGLTAEDTQSRIARLIDRIQDTREAMIQVFESGEETDGTRLGRAVTTSIDIMLPCARGLLDAARGLVADPLNLLSRWIANQAHTIAQVNRAEWVLDGWEPICLLWQSAADNPARRAALLEMAQIIPFLPRETMEWSRRPLPAAALAPACRVACQNDDWRSGGSAVALIGRNEALRAMSL